MLKTILPRFLINWFHYLYAWYGSVVYDHPSEELLVIGVTGTSGKSTTAYFLRQMLEQVGYRVGVLSTIEFYINGKQKLNDQKMTMLGRAQNHKFLKEMVDEDCDIVILETTSEGALQHRHKFINYDFIIFTSLYPEHIESHGSFENYKQCKMDILEYVSKCKNKYLCDGDITSSKKVGEDCKKIPKTVFVNGNNEYAEEVLDISFDKKYVFARDDQKSFYNPTVIDKEIKGAKNNSKKGQIRFSLKDREFQPAIYGEHNILNTLACISVLKELEVEDDSIAYSVNNLKQPPGRIEFIQEAEPYGFQVIVDYAFEPEALKSLYKTVEEIKPNRIIHVCGSAGGGRDKSRRNPIGKIAGRGADVVIVTNEDPYDEDPMDIIKNVSKGAQEVGKELDEDLFQIKAREKAISKAISLASEGDLVLITGKGSEQGIVEKGKIIPWDDREAVKEEIKEFFE